MDAAVKWAAMSFRFTTAGESHGPGLTAIVEGERCRQDNDGVSNVDEVRVVGSDPSYPSYWECEKASPLPTNGVRDGSPVRRHPYNPCLPSHSDTCARYGLRD